jgi:predicted transcriptional regulator
MNQYDAYAMGVRPLSQRDIEDRLRGPYHQKGNMTDPTQKLLLLAIKRSEPCTLEEMVRAIGLVTDVTPEQVHDTLNTLIQGGFIQLSPNGCYTALSV